MKKVIYSFLLTTIIALAASSCTDENVSPQGGGDSEECAKGWCK